MPVYLLFIPGGLFLLVVFIRVGLPYLRTPAWRRPLKSAAYHRYRDEWEKSDEILEKALGRFPDRSEVYLEYYLNHSDSADLKRRFEILKQGWKRTGAVQLGFFLGSSYLENGEYDKAKEILDTPQCREYMKDRRIPMIPQLYLEMGDWERAEEEFLDFHGIGIDTELEDLEAEELILLALIRKAEGGDWAEIMRYAPKEGIHMAMTWKDYLAKLKNRYKDLKPAVTGIEGDPSRFNERRREFFIKRIRLIEDYLSLKGTL
ncbi:MAG: tetratricopeptide repeat protein [bacterium]